MIKTVIDWILHLDHKLNEMVAAIGPEWVYLVLFTVVFCETGLVILPFLPGDSLLFAVGALCATEGSPLSLYAMLPLLIVAAILGDAINYWVGALIGPKVFKSNTSWWLNKQHLVRAQMFYEKYGAKAIIMARFVPIVRTFAPFVAGIGRMNFGRFWLYNVVGGVIWVTTFLIAGYLLGRHEFIQKYFFLVTLGIIAVSVLPVAWEWWKVRQESAAGNRA